MGAQGAQTLAQPQHEPIQEARHQCAVIRDRKRLQNRPAPPPLLRVRASRPGRCRRITRPFEDKSQQAESPPLTETTRSGAHRRRIREQRCHTLTCHETAKIGTAQSTKKEKRFPHPQGPRPFRGRTLGPNCPQWACRTPRITRQRGGLPCPARRYLDSLCAPYGKHN